MAEFTPPARPTTPTMSTTWGGSVLDDAHSRYGFLAPSEVDYEPLLLPSGNGGDPTFNMSTGRTKHGRKDSARRTSVGWGPTRIHSTYSEPETSTSMALREGDSTESSRASSVGPVEDPSLYRANTAPAETQREGYRDLASDATPCTVEDNILSSQSRDASIAGYEFDGFDLKNGSMKPSCGEDINPLYRSQATGDNGRPMPCLGLCGMHRSSDTTQPTYSDLKSSRKSSIAGAAVTHMDVQVLNLSPDRRSLEAQPSKNTSRVYEAISNDGSLETESEHDESMTPCSVSSDPGPMLATYIPVDEQPSVSGSHGFLLNRVDNKLNDWSWGTRVEDCDGGQMPPKLTGYARGEDHVDGIPSHYDDLDEITTAPPVCGKLTEYLSHYRAPSRSPSESSSSLSGSNSDNDSDSDQEDELEGAERDTSTAREPRSSKNNQSKNLSTRKSQSLPRKPSAVPDGLTRFRGIRDSIALAHNRLHLSNLALDRYGHRDSVALAKLRLYRKKNIVQGTPKNEAGPQEQQQTHQVTVACSSINPGHIRIMDAGKIWNADQTSLSPNE